jgi:peptidylprolyl isomerase
MRLLLGLILAFTLAVVLPASAAELDQDNTVFMDLTYGRVVIKLRPDLAPNHVERVTTLVKKGSTMERRSIA